MSIRREKQICRRRFLKAVGSAALGAALAGTNTFAADGQNHKKLHKALKIGMLPKKLSDADKFKLARRCGFEGIDAEPLDSLDAMREQAGLARAASVPIHGLVFGGWDTPLSDPNPKIVKKGLTGMENALRCANAINATTVLLVPAIVTEKVSYADAYKRSQQNVRKLLPLAAELNVVITIENVWNKFLLSPLEFARYIDELDSPYVRVNFDVGNVIIFGYAQDWIRTLGRRILKIDVKDFKRDGYKWVNLLDGDVNFPAVRRALDEIGYTGWLSAELNRGDERYLTDLAKRMDRIIEM